MKIPHPVDHPGPSRELLLRRIDEFRSRIPSGDPYDVFGVEVSAVLLDHVVDSLFESLTGLRQIADEVEQRVLGKEWLWDRKAWPELDKRLLGRGK